MQSPKAPSSYRQPCVTCHVVEQSPQALHESVSGGPRRNAKIQAAQSVKVAKSCLVEEPTHQRVDQVEDCRRGDHDERSNGTLYPRANLLESPLTFFLEGIILFDAQDVSLIDDPCILLYVCT
jgi:hypothetical protein